MAMALTGALIDSAPNYQTPTTGDTITIGNNDLTIIVDPAATLATLTIKMPATPFDGQLLFIRGTQAITSMTVSPNVGQSTRGITSPSAFSAGWNLLAIYRLGNTTWYF